MCITQHIHRCLNNLWYISLYVMQGLSSKLQIGMRHHPQWSSEGHVILKGVAISGESFFTNNGIHTEVSITTFHCM